MKFPHKFIKSEHGRSMVEILGVLAIIGMLSLGSVWLYDYASKFYEANHIQDSLGKAKNLADVNQSSTHIREVERLLRQTVGQYNPQIQQTEIRNPDTDGQKMTYTVTLKEVDKRVCLLTMNKKDVLSSVNITIMAPASADECDSGMDMAFAFDTIRTDIVCQNDSDCAGTHNPFCKNGQCKACEPSDCHGTEPICNKYSGACEPCSNDNECHPNKCATNGSCGECSSNEHCTDEFRPICDTYEGVCKPCATDGDCEPKYCAGNGTCGECSAHPHCPNTKPKCDAEVGVCEACPTGTPFWKADEEKCITCYDSNSATPYWNNTKQQCVKCLQNSHCSGTTPVCNSSNVCEACPSGYGFSSSQNKCVVQRTVTINNVGTKTTQIVLDGDTMAKPSASYPDFTFNHWSTTKGGGAVTFPLKVTSNITLYAYYRAASEIDVGDYPLNKCGGGRLGSEHTETSRTFSYSTPQQFKLYLRSAWNNDGYNCSGKQGSFSWVLDGTTTANITTHCQNINVGVGKTIVLQPYSDWSKYCDVVWRAHLYRTPQISYPY